MQMLKLVNVKADDAKTSRLDFLPATVTQTLCKRFLILHMRKPAYSNFQCAVRLAICKSRHTEISFKSGLLKHPQYSGFSTKEFFCAIVIRADNTTA